MISRHLTTATLVAIGVLGAGRAAAQATWTVDAKPILDISGITADRKPFLERPVGATRLATGGVIVADGSLSHVRFFDATGKMAKSVGQQGPGWRKGEFRTLTWLGRCRADSVFVWDAPTKQMSVLTPAGAIAVQYRIPESWNDDNVPSVVACSSSGVLAYQLEPSARKPEKPDAPVLTGVAAVIVADMRGISTATLPELPTDDMVPATGGVTAAPLGKRTSLAIVGTRLYVGNGDSASIAVFGLDGKQTGTVTLDVPVAAPTKEQQQRAVDMLAARVDPEVREGFKKQLMDLPLPERAPAYYGFLADPADLLWIVLSAPGEPQTRLRAVDAAGMAVADVTLADAVTVFEVGKDYLIGGYTDKAGAAHVAVYRLKRA